MKKKCFVCNTCIEDIDIAWNDGKYYYHEICKNHAEEVKSLLRVQAEEIFKEIELVCEDHNFNWNIFKVRLEGFLS